MGEKFLSIGNEAIGWGALMANCDAFFGYPITPQNEITEWFAREYPKRNKVFFQATSETAAINMVYGGAAYGVRVMTSTSSPGWDLIQETMSHLVNAELPAVIVLVQRGGPGQGTTRHAQMDYLSVTRGGGQGGHKNIVLCPYSVQECCDLTQLAFLEHLDKKYKQMAVSEERYETYEANDAQLLLVAYGYTARVCREACNMARASGLKVGLVRPITVWPFPYEEVRRRAEQGLNSW